MIIPFSLDIPRMGNIILYRSNGNFINRLIEKAQAKAGFSLDDARFTHCEVSGGGLYSVNISPPKTTIADITKKYKGYYVKIMELKYEDYAIKRYKIAFWAATICNIRYDYQGVLHYILPFIPHSRSKWYCSEGILWAVRKQYPDFYDGLKETQCMPAHYLNNKWLACKWQGFII